MRVLSVLVLIALTACKDPFIPNLKLKKTNFLVVEGYVNVGVDAVTMIRLSRTVPVSESRTEPLRESGAVIYIEDGSNTKYLLHEAEDGIYISDTLSLPLNTEYRLQILTRDETVFFSEFTMAVETPAMDSVSWSVSSSGIDIWVATHDPDNLIQYYQWDYDEVWEDRSPYFSFYRYNNGGFENRDNQEISNMRNCWKRASPQNLIMESTKAFSANQISKKLISIPVNSERLAEKYSVVVRQHALSQSAFDYLQIMEKNSNELGTLYDPQPAQLVGNISARNSNEPVVGYVGAYSTSEQRIYIDSRDISWNYDLRCEQVMVPVASPDSVSKYFILNNFIPITYDEPRENMFAAVVRCTDCRTRGGNNIKPDFWDDAF